MKKYKFLVPIVLVVIFAASIYMLYDARATIVTQYTEFLDAARNYRSQDIQVDAENNYKKALNVKPSLELYIEIGEFYKETEQTKKTISWGNQIITEYPKEVRAYEFLMDIYAQKKDYVACFELADKFNKRKLSSDSIQNILSTIEYEYFFNCEFTDVGIFSGGLCPVKNEGKWGYVNVVGDKVVANKYSKVGYHSGELAPVIENDAEVYFIDSNGNKKKVIQGVDNVKELGLIENNIFSLYNGDTWGFYDGENKLLFGDYKEVSAMGNGIAAVKRDTWTIVDREGKDLTGTTYDGVAMDEKSVVFRNERLFVYYDLSYHMIDSTGKTYGDAYQDTRVFADATYAAVKINNKWGFVDKDGNITIEAQYEDARSFSNGLAAIKHNGKWGFIDMSGKIVIEPKFDGAKDFTSGGSVFVMVDKTWKLLRLFKYNY